MRHEVGKSAHVGRGKPVDGDWLVATFARQHAEDCGAVMKRQENVAARVDVERTVVIIPEVISEQSA